MALRWIKIGIALVSKLFCLQKEGLFQSPQQKNRHWASRKHWKVIFKMVIQNAQVGPWEAFNNNFG